MVKRPAVYPALALMFAILFTATGRIIFILPVIAVIAGLLLMPCRPREKRSRVSLIIFTVMIAVFGMIRCFLDSKRIDRAISYKGYGEIRGYVKQRYDSDDGVSLIVKDAKADGTDLLNVSVKTYETPALPGDYVKVRGRRTLFEPAKCDGMFDARTYHRNRMESCIIRKADVTVLYRPGLSFRRLFFRFRTRMTGVFESALPGEEGPLLSSMLLGDKSSLDDETYDLFRMAGIIHLLAISGTHISVIAKGAYKCVRLRGGIISGGIISSLIAVIYGSICGGSAATDRAVIMFILMVSAVTMKKRYDMVSAMAVALSLELLINPLMIGDTGLILSYTAVCLVNLIAGPVSYAYIKKKRTLWEKKIRTEHGLSYTPSIKDRIISGFIGALVMELSLFPVTAYFFHEVPTFVFLLNLFLIPMFPLLIICGFAAGLINLFIPFKFLFMPCHFMLYLMEASADKTLLLPGARLVTGAVYVMILILSYVLAAVFIYVMKSGFRWRYMLILVFSAALVFIPVRNEDRIDFLDVGQGDGIFIRESGTSVMVDGGSSDVSSVGKYRIIPYLKYHSIGRVDYWIVSHVDNDHISGLKEALEGGYKIRNLVVAKNIPDDDDWVALRSLAEKRGVKISYALPGDAIRFDGGSINFIYPAANTSASDRNDLCLSFIYDTGNMRALFTGDLSEKAEKDLLSRYRIKNIDVIKAGHHGSDGSNCMELLRAAAPEIAVISAGINNRYGHPGRETLKRFSEINALSICTMDHGSIRIKTGGKTPVAEPYVN